MANFSEHYFVANAKYFPSDRLPFIKERLDQLPEEREIFVSALEFRDPLMMLIVSWFAGTLGIDRFLIGDTTLGVLKLVTLGGCGIWAIIDLFLTMQATREANLKRLMELL